VLLQPGFERLEYFRATDAATDRVDYETWADAPFDFAANLTYHYPALLGRRTECALGVSLSVRRPESAEGRALRAEFIRFFARRLGADLSVLRAAADAYEGKEGEAFTTPRRVELGPLVGEVVGASSYHRGEFLTVGFYDRIYDDSLRRARP